LKLKARWDDRPRDETADEAERLFTSSSATFEMQAKRRCLTDDSRCDCVSYPDRWIAREQFEGLFESLQNANRRIDVVVSNERNHAVEFGLGAVRVLRRATSWQRAGLKREIARNLRNFADVLAVRQGFEFD
jgi:hypothetical protein